MVTSSQVYTALRQMQLLWALTITGMEAEIRLETTRSHPVLISYDMMSMLEVSTCESEVSSLDKPSKPKVNVQAVAARASLLPRWTSREVVVRRFLTILEDRM
jgi:hypothetical protein